MSDQFPLIKTHTLSKIYQTAGENKKKLETTALFNLSLEINAAEFIAIMGPSGSGKSTLMHILGFLDRPSSGSYLFENQETSSFSEDQRAEIRKTKIGFVFQAYNLLPRTSALDNVVLPLLYGNEKDEVIYAKGQKMLKEVGLGGRLHHKPNELSGGQQQRVAIARALINNPSVIFADEPTGNLDTKSGQEIMEIFCELNKKGHTIILVTHEEDIASYTKRKIILKDGKIVTLSN